MKHTETITCYECDHDHEVAIIRGEYPSDDYSECPEFCENCGEPMESDIPSEGFCRNAERRQMGITY